MHTTLNNPEKNTFFRAGVGALIINSTGHILVMRRTDVNGEAWQLPQGGLRPDEDVRDALKREVREEVGLTPEDYQIIGECREWLVYELPKAYRSTKVGLGQVQKWFLCRFTPSPAAIIKPDGVEFNDYEWVTVGALLGRVVDFRLSVYKRLALEFDDWLAK
jgi:putative (di)nucleoside polyphosphate hydrolase